MLPSVSALEIIIFDDGVKLALGIKWQRREK